MEEGYDPATAIQAALGTLEEVTIVPAKTEPLAAAPLSAAAHPHSQEHAH